MQNVRESARKRQSSQLSSIALTPASEEGVVIQQEEAEDLQILEETYWPCQCSAAMLQFPSWVVEEQIAVVVEAPTSCSEAAENHPTLPVGADQHLAVEETVRKLHGGCRCGETQSVWDAATHGNDRVDLFCDPFTKTGSSTAHVQTGGLTITSKFQINGKSL